MARVKLEIPSHELQKAIEEAEKNGPFENRSKLHDAVAATDWAKNFQPKPVTASVVGLRIAEFGLECKTPKGKRGRRPGQKIGGNGPVNRTSRKEKFAANPQIKSHFDEMDEHIVRVCDNPDRWLSLNNKARKGSVTAAIKLNCAACMGFDNVASMVRGCTARGTCPLWAVRPYQNLTVEGSDVDSDETEDQKEDLVEAVA